MNKLFLFFLVFIAGRFNGSAQFGTAEKIRVYYTKVNAKITEAQKDKMSMYCNEVVVNKGGAPWPAVGNYKKRILLWYSGEPVNSGIDDPESLLDKVITSGESASEKFSEEFLYYGSELIFYFLVNTHIEAGKAQPAEEHRLYFSKGKLLKYDLKESSRKVDADTKKAIQEDALSHARIMQQLFLNSCEYWKDEALNKSSF